jgi:hypothetical protein
MRTTLVILLIAICPLNGLATSTEEEPIVGTVVAYDYFNNLIQITIAPSRVSLIVRTRQTCGKPSELIEVRYTYWSSEKPNNGGFPNELVTSARLWRFRLARDADCLPLKEFVPFMDAKTGKESSDHLPIWKLLSGAEQEKLPFGQTLPCYSLKDHEYKSIGR